jgi:hypothetical protein
VGAVATFDYPTWIASYPQFNNCTSLQGQGWWNRAGLILNPDGGSPVATVNELSALLYLLTSHIGWLNAPRDALGNPAATGTLPPAVVGRISSASQGSSSASIEWNGSGSPSEAWYIQTPFGAEYWNATAKYRTMRYRANPTFVPTAAFPGPIWRGRRWR